GPTPLILASSASERGRSTAIDSKVLLWATVYAGFPALAPARHSRNLSSSPTSAGSRFGAAPCERLRLTGAGVSDAGSGSPIVSRSARGASITVLSPSQEAIRRRT